MAEPGKADGEPVQFAWGQKRGRGKELNVQFYSSFTYDGIGYSLYDSVYLHKEGEPEPFIGKLIKMWEQLGNRKRVKILWFFRPLEIRNFLGEKDNPLQNELFLACGQGVGVSDVNPLEVIAGKCNVVCTSHDPRNPQPSDEELKLADYIFYRTFDVGLFRISDEIGETIDGVEAKYIFNSIEKSTPQGSHVNGARKKPSPVADVVPEKIHSIDPMIGVQAENSGPVEAPNGSSFKKRKHPDSSIEQKSSKGIDATEEKRISKQESEFSCLESGKPRPSMSKPDFRSEMKTSRHEDAPDYSSFKKRKDLDAYAKQKSSKATDATKEKRISKVESEKLRPSVSIPDVSLQKRQNFDKFEEVARRPGAETSKWFTGLPWEKQVRTAREQGTLLVIENFDSVHTSEEIEDLIYHFFKKQCTARVIEFSMFSSPYYGRALVICKSKGDAEEIVKRLKENVLMLSNGRPLIARVMRNQRSLSEPKSVNFHGHYVADMMKPQSHREEMRNAVATSHCAQSNTLEFEMAVDWMVLHEKSAGWWRELHEEHDKEVKKLRHDRPAVQKRA